MKKNLIISFVLGFCVFLGLAAVTVSPPGTGGSSSLSGMSDTDTSGAANGQVLTYNGGDSKWWPSNSGGVYQYAYTNALKIFVSTNGNDTTAMPGNKLLPFKTVGAASGYLTNNSTMIIEPGEYTYDAWFNTNGTFYTASELEHDILIKGITNVAILGAGPSTVLRPQSWEWGEAIGVYNSENVYIGNLSLWSTNMAGSDQQNNTNWSAICFYGANQNIVIQDMVFKNHARQVISHLFDYPRASTNVLIANNHFYNVGTTNLEAGAGALDKDGAAVSGVGTDWRIINNYMEDILRGVEIQTGNAGEIQSRNVAIIGNTMRRVQNNAFSYFNGCENVLFKDNHITMLDDSTVTSRAIEINDVSDGLWIVNNYIKGSLTDYALYSESGAATNVFILNNHFTEYKGGVNIWDNGGNASGVQNVTIKGNLFEYGLASANRAIQFEGRDSLIEGNTFIDATSASGQGIIRLVSDSSNVVVRANYIDQRTTPATNSYAMEVAGNDHVIYGNKFDIYATGKYSGTGTDVRFGFNWNHIDIGSGTPTDNYILKYDSASGKFGLEADAGASSSPGGADTQVQYNNTSSFDGASGVTIVGGETNLTVTGNFTNEFAYLGEINVEGDGSTAGNLKFKEDDGTSSYTIKADSTLAADKTITLTDDGVELDAVTYTDVIRAVGASYAKVGSGSTNIVVDADAHGYRWVNGSVNVNFSHIANQVNGEHPSLVYMLTNHTGTSGGITFNAGTNNWIFAYSQATPTTITNGTALRVVIEPIGTTNALVGYEYYPVPTQ